MSNTAKFAAEAIGTFALCFVGAASICIARLQGAGYEGLLGVAMAHGLILSIGVSAAMNISGGHLNPAVSLAMLVTGRIELAGFVLFVFAQLLGAIIAGVLLLLFFSQQMVGESSVVQVVGLGTPSYNPDQLPMYLALLIEAAMTFLLVYAVFGTAVDPRAPKIGGFGVGLTIAADILMGGPLTGASMNPARTFGPGVVAALSGNHALFWGQQIVYWLGPFLGAALAGYVYDRLIMMPKPSSE